MNTGETKVEVKMDEGILATIVDVLRGKVMTKPTMEKLMHWIRDRVDPKLWDTAWGAIQGEPLTDDDRKLLIDFVEKTEKVLEVK